MNSGRRSRRGCSDSPCLFDRGALSLSLEHFSQHWGGGVSRVALSWRIYIEFMMKTEAAGVQTLCIKSGLVRETLCVSRLSTKTYLRVHPSLPPCRHFLHLLKACCLPPLSHHFQLQLQSFSSFFVYFNIRIGNSARRVRSWGKEHADL